ncbi:MAG: SDR family NAD(P)-dependent oxidoreductase, partial [Proteobacteria bacterium]|nr:SDR family NAD(P)-dependent oxidoreductase [Pseudomonadota bacterium]
MTVKDKVCVITGAASGIGFAIARRFIEDGAKIVIADLNADGAAKAAAELGKAGTGEAIGIAMDVTNEDQVNAGIQKVIDTWGRIDVLVSNAGIQSIHRIEDSPFADWKKMLAIHL